MEEKYTIEEIKNYILSQDSLGDVLYFLNHENIKKANTKVDFPEENQGNCTSCDHFGYDINRITGGKVPMCNCFPIYKSIENIDIKPDWCPLKYR